MRAKILVQGIVQGVGFRPFIYRIAIANRLVGHVRNRGDAGVEIVVEGKNDDVKHFIADLKRKKPPLSNIYSLDISYTQDQDGFAQFSIIKSFDGGDLSGSIIPYDVSLCDECVRELRDPEDRRYNYFFITCTDCGPRYTIIERLPYDRSNTTMHEFPLCDKCTKEYANPVDRRFHAQTIACQQCGPQVFLATNDGQPMNITDPIREAGRLIGAGYVVAIKGNGGFHLAASTMRSQPLMRLRNVKHRAQKPFAVMARNLLAVKSFAHVSKAEAQLLTSSIRPIVLLNKKRDYGLSEQISPKLHNVGVMLPYTGLHYMLFDQVQEPAFVMTSANAPSEPIVTDNHEALHKLGNLVDFFLFHDRKIAQRCDDSVLRVHKSRTSIIRRSRGYAPSPIYLRTPTKHSTLGLGAEENVNACILLRDKAFISQYIGDVEQLATLTFLEETTQHLMRLTNGQIAAVACDLHPQFITKKLAQEFGHTYKCPVIPVQHHYAHILSLMGERGLDTMVGIACDGVGYGSDGTIWGGEILHCTMDGFTRLGHLQEHPMIGGDLATKYPLRMTVGILRNAPDIEDWILSKAHAFPYREREVELVLKQMEGRRVALTSSCGRVLDAVSALLGLCYERTYEGEPAMKLESAAIQGKDVLRLTPRIEHDVVDTTYLVYEIFKNRQKYSPADLACSAETYIAESLAELAVYKANEIGAAAIGFSGGVAYNEHITATIRRAIEQKGLHFLVHDQVPPGDGGISFGQALAASHVLTNEGL
ncbi:MAG: carbamoyltransferase HypF [Candidatus Bathyarchaeota archaeon]|nr:MAG: carbamoyltransferase HypF [Candidatus Bathyarchaeota archaeon]